LLLSWVVVIFHELRNEIEFVAARHKICLLTDGDAHKKPEGVVRLDWLLINFKWPINLADIIDV